MKFKYVARDVEIFWKVIIEMCRLAQLTTDSRGDGDTRGTFQSGREDGTAHEWSIIEPTMSTGNNTPVKS